jgi:hypothetical protein
MAAVLPGATAGAQWKKKKKKKKKKGSVPETFT